MSSQQCGKSSHTYFAQIPHAGAGALEGWQ
jgi:hypothetical protein